ncbi:MAG: alpha/beta hydrolase-fold protein [Prevotellaceae bacterium]|nr:alpha/beta hydrolase-fold protein [Prevotellaceae bacterium]MDY3365193.1 alpha/beta hydrolase-fold protein [Prevotella sp.]
MKKKLIAVLLNLITMSCLAQQIAQVNTVTLKSNYFDHDRTIFIYTPDLYQEYTKNEYDVIYVFDAQDRSKFDLVHSLPYLFGNMDNEFMRNFIVVGICSPYIKESDYSRNNDYLPSPLHQHDGLFKGKYHGNSKELKLFIKNELMPYINKNYRTTGHSLGIGHSLSASFILDAMITDELFDDYIAISANYCYDKERLANDFINYPFCKLSSPRFIFLSMADETTSWTEDWGQAWKKIEHFVLDEKTSPKNVKLLIKTYPKFNHISTYLPSMQDALYQYMQFLASNINYTSPSIYPIKIELTGCSKEDEVYITGNQAALGNWEPDKIKLKMINDSTKSINLKLHLPAHFKFTRGTWETEGYIKDAYPGYNLSITKPQSIQTYRIGQWADRQ